MKNHNWKDEIISFVGKICSQPIGTHFLDVIQDKRPI